MVRSRSPKCRVQISVRSRSLRRARRRQDALQPCRRRAGVDELEVSQQKRCAGREILKDEIVLWGRGERRRRRARALPMSS